MVSDKGKPGKDKVLLLFRNTADGKETRQKLEIVHDSVQFADEIAQLALEYEKLPQVALKKLNDLGTAKI